MILYHLLPFALSIGMTKKEFMKSKPIELKAYYKAYQLKKKMKDEEMWIQGAYFCNALEMVLSHLLSKKSEAKYIDKPFSFEKKERKGMEEVAVFEMKQRTKALKMQGLKESPI